jgi:hypothetical protein
LDGSYPLRLLGVSTRIWVFHRQPARDINGLQQDQNTAAARA